MALSKDLREYFGDDIAVVLGEGLEVNGCVLTAPNLTDKDLVKHYDKVITARVDGEWVGWGSVYGFIHYYCNKGKHKKDIEDVTYWGAEGCRNHLTLQYCLQGATIEELVDDDLLTKEDYEIWIGHRYGKKLPRVGRPLHIKKDSLYDERGFFNF